jgi:hypothetical protein
MPFINGLHSLCVDQHERSRHPPSPHGKLRPKVLTKQLLLLLVLLTHAQHGSIVQGVDAGVLGCEPWLLAQSTDCATSRGLDPNAERQVFEHQQGAVSPPAQTPLQLRQQEPAKELPDHLFVQLY